MPLDPKTFVYLEGCVRREGPFEVPEFPRSDGPLVYLGFGSLGASDVELIERMIAVFATLPARFIVNVGGFRDAYRAVPDNVYLEAWFPQPSVVAQCDLFIHHGGNNSFCEALCFGVPSLIMPYCWDGHDNAQRVEELKLGARLPRYDWRPQELLATVRRLLSDSSMKRRLRELSASLNAGNQRRRAAELILAAAREGATRPSQSAPAA